ncbi:hypothetical protein QYF36_013938 [Acer negundo]|nr:hypothetical protein QYF36_013938 [Acer negundo]
MGRERDWFWQYAEKLNGRFRCTFCRRDFSGGSTRIKSHLSGLSCRDIVICSMVPPDVKLAARQAITTPEKKLGKLRSLNNDGETQVISISAPNKKAKSLHQPTFLGECKKDKSVVDKMLAKFIISNKMTPDFAKMPYLVDLLRNVAEFGTSYEIPNTSALTSQLIPGIYKDVEEHIGNVKKLFTTTGCTLVMLNVKENFETVCFNVFAYTPAGFIYIDKIAVPEEEMTFSYLMNRIYSVIDSLGPENVVQCIFDIDKIEYCLTDFEGDDIFLSVHDMVCGTYPRILLHQMASNRFIQILMEIYFLVPWIRMTTKLAAVIFRYLHKHDFNLLPQRDHTSNIKEYSAYRVVTKVAVELFVLRTILEFEKELQAKSCEGPSREKNVAEIVDEAILSTEFWTRCKKVVQVLRALFRFLKFIYGNGSTFGYLYEASKRTEEAMKQLCDGDDQFHYRMIIKLFKDWKREEIKPVHVAAAFLNPAYFCSENFTGDTHEMQEGLHRLKLLVPPEEQEALLKQLQLYCLKVSDLFSDTAMEKLNTIHPGKWWECFGDPCPILQKLAVRILSQPCSTPLFPKLVNFQPNDWHDEVRMNTILMENFGTVKSQNSEPILLTSEDPDYAYEDVLKFLDEEDYQYDEDV